MGEIKEKRGEVNSSFVVIMGELAKISRIGAVSPDTVREIMDTLDGEITEWEESTEAEEDE